VNSNYSPSPSASDVAFWLDAVANLPADRAAWNAHDWFVLDDLADVLEAMCATHFEA